MAPRPRRNASAYLPRAEGDKPGVLAKGAPLYLMHKLSQLGVCPTAVVNLFRGEAGDFKEESTPSPNILCTSRNAWPSRLRDWGEWPQTHKPKATGLCPTAGLS